MTLFVTIAFLLFVAGIMLLLELSPFLLIEELTVLFKPKNTTMRASIERSRKGKQRKGIRLLVAETKEVLRLTGRSNLFTGLCILSLLLFVLGVLIALTMNNTYFVPVLAIGFSLLPFYFVKFTVSRYKKQLNTELETTLSIITNSYLRGKNNIIDAIAENEPYLNPPVSEVFRNFLLQAKLINSNIKEGLEQLKLGIDHSVFHEWVDAVIACQEDYNLKVTLPPIITKLSDLRVVSAELEVLLLDPVKEYITMVMLLISSIPLMYFLNAQWYQILMFTEFGKVLLAICGVVIFLSVAGVVKHTKPIEYKR